MNKLIILSLVACMACGVTGGHLSIERPNEMDEEQMSELALFETDDIEVAGVRRPEFRDYCVRARDTSKVFLEGSLNSVTLRVFNTLFNSLDDVAAEAAAIKERQVELGRQMILQLQKPVSEESNDESDGSNGSDENNTEPESRTFFRNFVEATKNVALSLIETIASEATRRLLLFKGEMTIENFKTELENACTEITDTLSRKLEDNFAVTKNELIDATTDEATKNELSLIRYEQVGCVTTNRIQAAAKVCYAFKNFGGVLYPILEGLARRRF